MAITPQGTSAPVTQANLGLNVDEAALMAAMYGAENNAYGSIPTIPPTSTDTSTSTTTSTPTLPNYDALSAQASLLAGEQMSGQLDPSVLALLGQQGAERGVATGDPGSPNANAAYLQALGLTDLGLEQEGITNYEGLLAGAPRTTTTAGSTTTDNNVLAAITKASPNPGAAAITNAMGATPGAAAGGGGTGGYRITAPPQTGALSYGSPTGAAAGLPAGNTALAAANTPVLDANGNYVLPTGNTYGNVSPTDPFQNFTGDTGLDQDVTNTYGSDWIDIGNGQQMNLATGDIAYTQSPLAPPDQTQPDTGLPLDQSLTGASPLAPPDQIQPDTGTDLDQLLTGLTGPPGIVLPDEGDSDEGDLYDGT